MSSDITLLKQRVLIAAGSVVDTAGHPAAQAQAIKLLQAQSNSLDEAKAERKVRKQEMLKIDVENSAELARLLFDLTQTEGVSVEICHPNMDFGGPNSMIVVKNVLEQTSQEYFGDSVLHCLQQAHGT